MQSVTGGQSVLESFNGSLGEQFGLELVRGDDRGEGQGLGAVKVDHLRGDVHSAVVTEDGVAEVCKGSAVGVVVGVELAGELDDLGEKGRGTDVAGEEVRVARGETIGVEAFHYRG